MVNRQVAASLALVTLFALLEACSAASGEPTEESATPVVTCLPPAQCIVRPGPISHGSGGSTAEVGPAPAALPASCVPDSSADGGCSGTCDPGFTSCELEPTSTVLENAGEALPCTPVFIFDEYGSDPLQSSYFYYVAYCTYSTTADQDQINAWVGAHASTPVEPREGVPYAANLATTQRTLGAADTGDIYLRYRLSYAGGARPVKCTGNGAACLVYPAY